MNLKGKIALSFLTVILLYAGVQAYFMNQQTKEAFRSYLTQEDKQKLTGYYRFFQDKVKNAGMDSIEGKTIQIRPPFLEKNGSLFVEKQLDHVHVANVDKVIIASDQEERIGDTIPDSPTFQKELTLNEETVGYVWLETKTSGIFSKIEESFIDGLQRASLLSFIVGLGIAFLVSLFLVRKITSPLKKLTQDVRHFSEDFSNKPAPLQTNDEFAVLSKAFLALWNKIEENETIRKQLVADVAHELRTPLTVLMNRFEAIQDGIVEPNQNEMAKMYDEVYRLTRLVNDLQELSLADAGRLTLNPASTSINSLVLKVIEAMNPLAEQKEVAIIPHLPDEQVIADIDEDRIRQIIINVIGNGIRHSPSGGVLTIALEQNEDWIKVHIKDEGEGIARDELPYVFERFYRKERSRTRTNGGAGLGLAIARGYAEAHKGTLTVTSTIGEGSCFTLSLPVD
ncbi:sensor histidine kinase [Pontibacillus salicampi]|uniref:histidine kinase n=1 Tax=Pontibacillus salicampi TaxID=1449801 RepID=A0ABV6LIR2_9BACI